MLPTKAGGGAETHLSRAAVGDRMKVPAHGSAAGAWQGMGQFLHRIYISGHVAPQWDKLKQKQLFIFVRVKWK